MSASCLPFFTAYKSSFSGLANRLAAAVLVAILALPASTALAWSLDDIAGLAKKSAALPFKAPSQLVPAELAALDYDGYRDIRSKPGSSLWRVGKPPTKSAFEANFFHVGPGGDAVRIHEITLEGVKPVPYNAASFSFGKNTLSPQTWGDLGHGGVRAFSNLNTQAYKDELIAFSGASYFRALGMGQRYGLSARGLAIDTTGGAKEEFPRFTDFWLEKPLEAAQQLTIFALLDSERMTGAYRFDVKPGEQTIVEVHARLFMRATSTPVVTLGLAPLTSMFFFGENQPRLGDFRPKVHDSDGLMVATGDGEWLWRPLQNPTFPLATSFSMKSLKGFGLMQRDRGFSSYEDTEARYELRPSAWVTPLGDWGTGRVELLQFGTSVESNDNVVAYWVPDKTPAPGQSIDLAYQIAWQGKTQQRPPNSWVTQSRRGMGHPVPGTEKLDQHIQFVIDFAGPALDALPEEAPVKAIVTTDSNARVLESLAYKNPATGAWRMTLRVQRLNPAEPVELRAFLQHNSNTLSETWTNLITP